MSLPEIPYLPLGQILSRDRAAFHEDLDAVLDSGHMLLGPALERFEAGFATCAGTRHFVGMASGLDAIALMLLALDYAPGSEILMPANTFVASALGTLRAGLVPVPVDIDPDTGNLDPALLEAAVTPRTRAVLAVHLHGIPCDADLLHAQCARLGLDLLEDAAQAHGATWKGRPCGSLGRAAAFSFYPGKNLGAFSDGGGVSCDDDALAASLKLWRNYGSREKYRHELAGWNSRLSDLDARFLSRRLARLDADNSRRRELADAYCRGLRNPHLRLPRVPEGAEPCWHLFPVLTRHRDALQAHLRKDGIASLVHYPNPLHRQECLPDLHGSSLPHAEAWCRETLSLPLHPLLSDAELARILESLDRFRP